MNRWRECMRFVFSLTLIVLLLASCGEAPAAGTAAGGHAEIHPLFEYSNYDGYFYVENGELYMLEAVFDDSSGDGNPDFVGYARKTLFTDVVMKGRTVESNVTAHAGDASPMFVKVESLEDMDKLWETTLSRYPQGKNRITQAYRGWEMTIDYDNRGANEQRTAVVFRNDRRTVTIIDDPALYIWHRIYDRYLALALLSAGGSGHTIYFEIYNLEDL
jgi:hypothetical protein